METSKLVKQKVKELKKLKLKVKSLNPYTESFQSGLENDFLLNGLINKLSCYYNGVTNLSIPEKDLEMGLEITSTVKNSLLNLKNLAQEVALGTLDTNAIRQKQQQFTAVYEGVDRLINNHNDLYNTISLVEDGLTKTSVALPCTAFYPSPLPTGVTGVTPGQPEYEFSYIGYNLDLKATGITSTSRQNGLLISDTFGADTLTDLQKIANAGIIINQIDTAVNLVNEAGLYFDSKLKVLKSYILTYQNLIKVLEDGIEKWKEDKCEYIDAQIAALEYDV